MKEFCLALVTFTTTLLFSCKPRSFHDDAALQNARTAPLTASKPNFGITFAPVTDQVVQDFLNSHANPKSFTSRQKGKRPEMAAVEKRVHGYFKIAGEYTRLHCAVYDFSTNKFTTYRRYLDKHEYGEVAQKYAANTWADFIKLEPTIASASACSMATADDARKRLDPQVLADTSAKFEPYLGESDGDGFGAGQSTKQGVFSTYTPLGVRWKGKLYSGTTTGHSAPANLEIIYVGDYVFPMRSYSIGKTTIIPVVKFNEKDEPIATYDLGEIFIRSLDDGPVLTTLVNSSLAKVWSDKAFDRLNSPTDVPYLDTYRPWSDLTVETNDTYDRLPVGSIHYMVNSAWFGGMDWAKRNVGAYTTLVVSQVKKSELLDLYRKNNLWVNTYDTYVGHDFADLMLTEVPRTHKAELLKAKPDIRKAANIPDGFLFSMELILGGKEGRKYATSQSSTRVVPIDLK